MRVDRQDASVTFVNVQGGPEGGPYACPCCVYITLAQRAYYEICPVCGWEDEGQDDHDADEYRGGRAMLRTCGSVSGGHAEGVPSRMILKVSE
jgi:hypothetical protein